MIDLIMFPFLISCNFAVVWSILAAKSKRITYEKFIKCIKIAGKSLQSIQQKTIALCYHRISEKNPWMIREKKNSWNINLSIFPKSNLKSNFIRCYSSFHLQDLLRSVFPGIIITGFLKYRFMIFFWNVTIVIGLSTLLAEGKPYILRRGD